MKTYRYSEVGRRHQRDGKGNQDACCIDAHGGYALAFVADGMGSAAHGAEAADIAVRAARQMASYTLIPLEDADDETGEVAVRAAFSAGYNSLQRSASDQGQLDGMQTTFMAAYLNERTGCLHYGYCGDGGIMVLLDDGSLRVATTPHKGETVYQTTSLLQHDAWEFGTIERVRAFALMTDGVYDALAARAGAARVEDARRFFDALFGLGGEDERRLLDAELSFRGSNGKPSTLFAGVQDDRTVVAAVGEGELPPAPVGASASGDDERRLASGGVAVGGSALVPADAPLPAAALVPALDSREIEELRVLLSVSKRWSTLRHHMNKARRGRHARV